MSRSENENREKFQARFSGLGGFEQEDAIALLKQIHQVTGWHWRQVWERLDEIKMNNTSVDMYANVSQDYQTALAQLVSEVLPPPYGPDHR